jgi:hypothetical protein
MDAATRSLGNAAAPPMSKADLAAVGDEVAVGARQTATGALQRPEQILMRFVSLPAGMADSGPSPVGRHRRQLD